MNRKLDALGDAYCNKYHLPVLLTITINAHETLILIIANMSNSLFIIVNTVFQFVNFGFLCVATF